MSKITVKVRHAYSREITAQIDERYGKGPEITDSVAVAIAAGWQSPGTTGSALAALASGTTVEYRELAEDIARTYRTADENGRRELDMLATWMLHRTSYNSEDYTADEDYPLAVFGSDDMLADDGTVTLDVSVTGAELATGWNGEISEFAASVRAALHEVIGDDGAAYVPTVRLVKP